MTIKRRCYWIIANGKQVHVQTHGKEPTENDISVILEVARLLEQHTHKGKVHGEETREDPAA